jgi:hypothetical protein
VAVKKTVKKRTVRFYVAEAATLDASGWPVDGDLVKKIRKKVKATVDSPYIELTDSSFILEHHNDDPLHVSTSAIRRDNLPLRERDGHTSVLKLDGRDNLAEPTHCVFFAGNIVGVIRSQTTPGHLKASSVISKRTGVDLILVPVVRPEIEQLVVSGGDVTKITLRVAGSSFDSQAAAAGDPVEAIHRLTDSFSGTTATVSVSASRRSADRQRLKDWVTRNFGMFSDDNSVKSAKVSLLDADGKKQMIDLLEDQIAQSVEIMTESPTRHPDPDEIRKVIVESFEEHGDEIQRALEIRAQPLT